MKNPFIPKQIDTNHTFDADLEEKPFKPLDIGNAVVISKQLFEMLATFYMQKSKDNTQVPVNVDIDFNKGPLKDEDFHPYPDYTDNLGRPLFAI